MIPENETPPVIVEDADPMQTPPGFRSGFAVLWGRPNVGKSTLLNRLVGAKVAIVSPRPQTTRNRLRGIINRDDAQVVFTDTPGIHRPQHDLGRVLNRIARGALPDAELIVWVVDASCPLHDDDRRAVSHLRRTTSPVVLCLNKCDMVGPHVVERQREACQHLMPTQHAFAVSALTGDGLSQFIDHLCALLPEGPAYFPRDLTTDQLDAFFITELIRERILHATGQEVPHSVAVHMEEMVERPGGKLYLRVVVFCERSSQKRILIGAGGKMIRRIGSESREQIQRFLDRDVYLDLRVKVSAKWRNREPILRRFGYWET